MNLSKERRNELLSDYVDRIIDNMSTKDLCRIVGDQLEENMQWYSDDELLTEIADHYSELLTDEESAVFVTEEN